MVYSWQNIHRNKDLGVSFSFWILVMPDIDKDSLNLYLYYMCCILCMDTRMTSSGRSGVVNIKINLNFAEMISQVFLDEKVHSMKTDS